MVEGVVVRWKWWDPEKEKDEKFKEQNAIHRHNRSENYLQGIDLWRSTGNQCWYGFTLAMLSFSYACFYGLLFLFFFYITLWSLKGQAIMDMYIHM